MFCKFFFGIVRMLTENSVYFTSQIQISRIMLKNILNEMSPLSDKDCFYIVERYKTEFTYPLHSHREFELNFIEGGAGVRRIVGDSSSAIGDYELVLICGEHLAHVWEQGDCVSKQIREVTIQFSPDTVPPSLLSKNQFSSIRKMFERAQNGLVFPLRDIMRVYALIDTLAAQPSGFRQMLSIWEILYELSLSEQALTLSSNAFAQIEPSANSRRIARVEEYVNGHLGENIRLSVVAQIAGMTPNAFSRFFRQHAGRSLSDYIIDLRLGAAARLLVDSTRNVAEIGYECGFNNLSNFNRIFKRKKGMTPKAFREYYRKKKIIC